MTIATFQHDEAAWSKSICASATTRCCRRRRCHMMEPFDGGHAVGRVKGRKVVKPLTLVGRSQDR